MKNVRRIIFETNSSSTHVLTMCTEEEYKEWEEGKYLYSVSENKLVPSDEARYKSPDLYMTKKQYDKYIDSLLLDRIGDHFEGYLYNIKAFGYFYFDY